MTSVQILKPIQLTLFQLEPSWLDINSDWLLEFLQKNYPEANFKIFQVNDWGDEYEEIRATSSKRADVSFHIDRKNIDLTIWNNPMLIHCDVEQKYGHYSGMGVAVDNMENFKTQSKIFVDCWRKHVMNYKHYKRMANK